jgi:hydroxymethylbilane synthase
MAPIAAKTTILRIGTRGSALALAQAHAVQARLGAACGLAAERIEIKVIRTSGDAVLDRPLAELGGKGLFTKEIEQALLAGTIDIAVHSTKDVPAALPDGLTLRAFLPREDPRDALVSRRGESFSGLPTGSRVGTSSPRRQALLRHLRPDLTIVPLRGNVETRLRKIESGEADATILAVAGLKRLGLLAAATAILDPGDFLPTAGQGAIGIEIRGNDARTAALVAAINDADTADAVTTERAFLAVLDGNCRTPIAAYAQLDRDTIRFRGMIARPDGSDVLEVARQGPRSAAATLGREAGAALKMRGGADFFVQD